MAGLRTSEGSTKLRARYQDCGGVQSSSSRAPSAYKGSGSDLPAIHPYTALRFTTSFTSSRRRAM